MTQLLYNQDIHVRVILRESSDMRYKIVEDCNANYILLDENRVIAIYESKASAFKAFGCLTRLTKLELL